MIVGESKHVDLELIACYIVSSIINCLIITALEFYEMKANEFLKDNGLKKCSRIVEDLIEQGHGGEFVKDLKRLVESHELVEVGLPELKKAMFSDSKDLEYMKNWILTVSEKLLTEKGIKLKQAITDVESCK